MRTPNNPGKYRHTFTRIMSKRLRHIISPEKAGILAALALVMLLFLPRIATKGQFLDGLTYATISRNLAQDFGSWWSPQYLSPGVFYEHPPLHFWIQSIFFRLLGDHWWIDKLFALLVLAAHLFLLRWNWQLLFGRDTEQRGMIWLALVGWYITPTVSWGMPSNMLESTLTVWGLLSTGAWLQAIHTAGMRQTAWLLLSGIAIGAGFLTKGPVALFPLAAPAVWAFSQRARLPRAAWLIPGITLALILFCLWLYAPARHFFTEYWQSQVLRSLSGQRETSGAGWMGHFYLVRAFFTAEGLPLLALVGIILLAGWRYYPVQFPEKARFPLLIFLCATLPLLISIKQRTYYLMPAMPWLALALCGWAAPFARAIGARWPKNRLRFIGAAASVAILTAAIYSAAQLGGYGRDRDLIVLLEDMQAKIPAGEKLAACPAFDRRYQEMAYLARYGRWEFTPRLDSMNQYVLFNTDFCKDMPELEVGYRCLTSAGPWQVYNKK